jgi:hypothetical protein
MYDYNVNKHVRNNYIIINSKSNKFKWNRAFINIKEYIVLGTVHFVNIRIVVSCLKVSCSYGETVDLQVSTSLVKIY